MEKTLKAVAYDLGANAFTASNKRIPAHDKAFCEKFLKDSKVGESLSYLKAWLKGWDDSNLASKIAAGLYQPAQ